MKTLEIEALLDADKRLGGWALFKRRTTEKLAAKGYFEKATHPQYGEQYRLTEAGREALKTGLAAQR